MKPVVRPKSLAEVAERKPQGAFDSAVREFLDAWQGMAIAMRKEALAREPRRVGAVHDAYLAALAEHLALSARFEAPPWTEAAGRFLDQPFFAGGLESLKATLLVESPLAFRRRLIFISADALFRPDR